MTGQDLRLTGPYDIMRIVALHHNDNELLIFSLSKSWIYLLVVAFRDGFQPGAK